MIISEVHPSGIAASGPLLVTHITLHSINTLNATCQTVAGSKIHYHILSVLCNVNILTVHVRHKAWPWICLCVCVTKEATGFSIYMCSTSLQPMSHSCFLIESWQCFSTKLQDSALRGTSVALTSDMHTAAIFVLFMVQN
jgi:hypothetical protein